MMFLTDILFFIIFQLLVVYPLGVLVLDLLEVKFWWAANLVFGISIGIVVLTLSALILGYTNNYGLLPLLIIFSPILLVFKLKNISLKQISKKWIISRPNLVVISVIAFCVLVQSVIVFPNGVKPDGSLRIKGVFTEDAMWHIAIIGNLQKSIPPQNAIFAGEKLTNYNYFSDIYIAVIQKFTGIDTLTLYFKLVGPFLAFLCAVTLYFVLKALTKNQIIAGLGVLLVTLAGTYYYVFGILKPDLNINPSTFFGNEYVSRMVNYQLSFSYLIITTVIYLLLFSKKISLKFGLVIALLVSSSIGFKSYGTLIVIGALYAVGFLNIFKREFEFIKIAFFSSIFTIIFIYLFLRNSQAAETVFAFNPFWMIENMMTDSLRLNSGEWLAQRNYYLSISNYLGISYLYLKGLALFVLTQFGLKVLGFLYILRIREKRERGVILLVAFMAFFGTMMPVLFTQGGIPWNTIQFIWYSGFSLGILLILLISGLQKRVGFNLTVIMMAIAWISFLPGIYHYSKIYLSDNDNLTTYNFKGTQESYKAAKFLSGESEGLLLLNPLYLQTPFVVAMSGKNAYFADISILSNLLINWHDREQGVEKFFDSIAAENYQKEFLQKNNITYIFTLKDGFKSAEFLKNIYTNDEISIYRFINSF